MAGDFPGSGDPDQLVQLLALAAALAGLSAARRDVIVALYYRGLTIAETAEALGVPAGTVRSRSASALRRSGRRWLPSRRVLTAPPGRRPRGGRARRPGRA